MIAGAGSSEAFIARAFPAMPTVVDEVIAVAAHRGSAPAVAKALRDEILLARALGLRVIVGGVSFGAHASASHVATCPPRERPDGLVCVMPAWTGNPGAVAAATALTASWLRSRGIQAELARLEAEYPGDWVVSELRASWGPQDDRELAAELESVAVSPGPTRSVLASITVPSVVVGVLDDPLHPIEVAREWSAAIPGCCLQTLSRNELAADRGSLGRSAFGALPIESR